MQPHEHWDSVYGSKKFDAVSWYAPHLDVSLRLIERMCPQKSAAIIDVGGGESTLVDDLLDRGYSDLSVLDISAKAIDFTRKRLGTKAQMVKWHIGDVTQYEFASQRFDVWHDRAVFHFLTDPAARHSYVDQVRRVMRPGGRVLMATFGPNGPLQCSGLDVVRYDPQSLQREFGPGFQLIGSELADHLTPMGTTQQFLYCWFSFLH